MFATRLSCTLSDSDVETDLPVFFSDFCGSDEPELLEYIGINKKGSLGVSGLRFKLLVISWPLTSFSAVVPCI